MKKILLAIAYGVLPLCMGGYFFFDEEIHKKGGGEIVSVEFRFLLGISFCAIGVYALIAIFFKREK